MSEHFIKLNAIENERLALIDEFAGRLEATIDRMVADRVAQAMERIPRPANPPPVPRPPVQQQRITRPVVRMATRPAPPVSPIAQPIAKLPTMPSRTPTVIPAHVQITRLPPGPNPNERRRSGPSMDCRCPGCLMKSRGPRYEYFCEDHYRRFNAEERQKYAAMWRAARAQQ